jgi:hypothetical protein
VSKAPPPVPPANRNSKAPGESEAAAGSKAASKVDSEQAATVNPDQKGQAANTKQNTTHQGYQQDR